MAVATNMRRGGDPVPKSVKPTWTGDYDWDERLTGRRVVNWIRGGFGLPVSHIKVLSDHSEDVSSPEDWRKT